MIATSEDVLIHTFWIEKQKFALIKKTAIKIFSWEESNRLNDTKLSKIQNRQIFEHKWSILR